MKRRGFLGLLGLAPAAPLIAKEVLKQTEPRNLTQPTPDPEPIHYTSEPWNPFMCSAAPVSTLSYEMHFKKRR